MNHSSSYRPLNRLFAILYRSLPMYLHEADPYVRQQDEAAKVLRNIIRDQSAMAQRVGEMIVDRGRAVVTGEFPMSFTSLHDVSLDYLLAELIRRQQDDVAAIEEIVAELEGDPAAKALAEEALGSERAHLDALADIVKQAAP